MGGGLESRCVGRVSGADMYIYNFCHFLWPSCIRRMSDSAWLLGSRVRIPQRAWIFVLCAYFVLRR